MSNYFNESFTIEADEETLDKIGNFLSALPLPQINAPCVKKFEFTRTKEFITSSFKTMDSSFIHVIDSIAFNYPEAFGYFSSMNEETGELVEVLICGGYFIQKTR